LSLSTDFGNALWARGIVADSHKPGNNTAETRLPGCGRGSRQNRDDRGAAAGILVNGVTALLFARGRKGDLNVKGAFLHMAADAAVSAGVVVSGLVILLTGWAWLDPVVYGPHPVLDMEPAARQSQSGARQGAGRRSHRESACLSRGAARRDRGE
jgi:cation efflux family protein